MNYTNFWSLGSLLLRQIEIWYWIKIVKIIDLISSLFWISKFSCLQLKYKFIITLCCSCDCRCRIRHISHTEIWLSMYLWCNNTYPSQHFKHLATWCAWPKVMRASTWVTCRPTSFSLTAMKHKFGLNSALRPPHKGKEHVTVSSY